VGRPEELPLDHGLAAQLPDRVQDLRAHILETKPNAKIAVLYQNDDYGKDYLKGFEDGLGDKAKRP
jgi:branched-chain amino acid transport system substrate-binding protein